MLRLRDIARKAPLWLALVLVAASLEMCSSFPAEESVARVAKDWSLAMRANQVLPVYPLTEDLIPGDILLSTTPIEEQVQVYRSRGYLPLDQMVNRLDRPTETDSTSLDNGYGSFYAEFNAANSLAGGNPAAIQDNKRNPFFRKVVFPSFSTTLDAASKLGVALPINGLQSAAGFFANQNSVVSISIGEALTYGLPNTDLYTRVNRWSNENQTFLSHYAPRPSFLFAFERPAQYSFLRVVTRVYLVKQVTISISSSTSVGLAEQLSKQKIVVPPLAPTAASAADLGTSAQANDSADRADVSAGEAKAFSDQAKALADQAKALSEQAAASADDAKALAAKTKSQADQTKADQAQAQADQASAAADAVKASAAEAEAAATQAATDAAQAKAAATQALSDQATADQVKADAAQANTWAEKASLAAEQARASVEQAKASILRASGGAALAAAEQRIEANAAIAEGEKTLRDFVAQLNANNPSMSISSLAYSDRTITLNATFDPPVVIGYAGFDVPILQYGLIGFPISTMEQLTSQNPRSTFDTPPTPIRVGVLRAIAGALQYDSKDKESMDLKKSLDDAFGSYLDGRKYDFPAYDLDGHVDKSKAVGTPLKGTGLQGFLDYLNDVSHTARFGVGEEAVAAKARSEELKVYTGIKMAQFKDRLDKWLGADQ